MAADIVLQWEKINCYPRSSPHVTSSEPVYCGKPKRNDFDCACTVLPYTHGDTQAHHRKKPFCQRDCIRNRSAAQHHDFGMMLTLIVQLVGTVAGISLNIRRFHDFNKSGWWILIFMVPFVNLYFSIKLLCIRGDVGANNYGADPF